MSHRTRLLILQLAILAALGLSSALMVDQLGPTPAYCNAGSGCEVARAVATRWLGPLPMPLLGGLAFLLLLVLSAGLRHARCRQFLRLAAAVGGILGLTLLLVQAVILKRFCPLCVGVDLLSIAVAIGVFYLGTAEPKPVGERPHLMPTTVFAYALVVLLVPAVWPHFRAVAKVPSVLLPYQVEQRVTLIEFVDLQCAHCRALYPTLTEFAQDHADEVSVIRLHVPFSRHVRATQAARLLHCVSDRVQREQLEKRYFEADSLSEAVVVEAAKTAGLSQNEIDQCLNLPTSLHAVNEHIALFHRLGRLGLPVTFIGGEQIGGAMPKVAYEAALARVKRSPAHAMARQGAFLGIIFGLVVALYVAGRPRKSGE